jgi:hypothetical protein
LCKDNDDMAKWYDLSDARAACKRDANAMAKYGTPEWRARYFATYRSGTDWLAEHREAD